jgi:uncharacterized membrane protein YkoI
MSSRSRLQVFAVVLLVAVVGVGVAMASGSDEDPTRGPALVGDDDVENAEEAEVEDDAAEPANTADALEDEAEGPDQPITGPDLERASQLALDYLGGGRVTGTEIEDEESYYEIEVTLDDGTQVDVQLNESFEVVGTD